MQTLLPTCWNKALDNAVSLSETGSGAGSGQASATDFWLNPDAWTHESIFCCWVLGLQMSRKGQRHCGQLWNRHGLYIPTVPANNLLCQHFSGEDLGATSSFHNHHLWGSLKCMYLYLLDLLVFNNVYSYFSGRPKESHRCLISK